MQKNAHSLHVQTWINVVQYQPSTFKVGFILVSGHFLECNIQNAQSTVIRH